jgi:hypothetical protein
MVTIQDRFTFCSVACYGIVPCTCEDTANQEKEDCYAGCGGDADCVNTCNDTWTTTVAACDATKAAAEAACDYSDCYAEGEADKTTCYTAADDAHASCLAGIDTDTSDCDSAYSLCVASITDCGAGCNTTRTATELGCTSISTAGGAACDAAYADCESAVGFPGGVEHCNCVNARDTCTNAYVEAFDACMVDAQTAWSACTDACTTVEDGYACDDALYTCTQTITEAATRATDDCDKITENAKLTCDYNKYHYDESTCHVPEQACKDDACGNEDKPCRSACAHTKQEQNYTDEEAYNHALVDCSYTKQASRRGCEEAHAAGIRDRDVGYRDCYRAADVAKSIADHACIDTELARTNACNHTHASSVVDCHTCCAAACSDAFLASPGTPADFATLEACNAGCSAAEDACIAAADAAQSNCLADTSVYTSCLAAAVETRCESTLVCDEDYITLDRAYAKELQICYRAADTTYSTCAKDKLNTLTVANNSALVNETYCLSACDNTLLDLTICNGSTVGNCIDDVYTGWLNANAACVTDEATCQNTAINTYNNCVGPSDDTYYDDITVCTNTRTSCESTCAGSVDETACEDAYVLCVAAADAARADRETACNDAKADADAACSDSRTSCDTEAANNRTSGYDACRTGWDSPMCVAVDAVYPDKFGCSFGLIYSP